MITQGQHHFGERVGMDAICAYDAGTSLQPGIRSVSTIEVYTLMREGTPGARGDGRFSQFNDGDVIR